MNQTDPTIRVLGEGVNSGCVQGQAIVDGARGPTINIKEARLRDRHLM